MYFLQAVEENGEELQQASENDEHMEYGVYPGLFGSDAVKHGTDGVGNAARQQEPESRKSQYLNDLRDEGDDPPAHADVADHGKHVVLLQIDGGQGHGQSGKTPFYPE